MAKYHHKPTKMREREGEDRQHLSSCFPSKKLKVSTRGRSSWSKKLLTEPFTSTLACNAVFEETWRRNRRWLSTSGSRKLECNSHFLGLTSQCDQLSLKSSWHTWKVWITTQCHRQDAEGLRRASAVQRPVLRPCLHLPRHPQTSFKGFTTNLKRS